MNIRNRKGKNNHFMSEMIVNAGACLEQAVSEHPEIEEDLYLETAIITSSRGTGLKRMQDLIATLPASLTVEITNIENDLGCIYMTRKHQLPIVIAVPNLIEDDPWYQPECGLTGE